MPPSDSRAPKPAVIAPAAPAGPSVLGRLGASVIKHRRRVMLIWLVLFMGGGFAASQMSKRLSYDFSLPGQPAYKTGLLIQKLYGNGGNTTPSVVVVTVPAGQTVTGDAGRIGAAFAAVSRSMPDVRVVEGLSADGKDLVTGNGRTMAALLFAPPNQSLGADPVTQAAVASITKALPAYGVGVTGIAQLGAGGSSSGPGVLVETIFGGLGALAVLAFVFASLLALVPLLVAAVSIPSTFLLLLGLSYVTSVSFIVQFLVALLGLGVAIDYSLLLVTRWREERAHGRTNDEAVIVAMQTAGRAVVLSGLTVAIGLMVLVVLPVPFLRSTGLGGMLIPVVSVAVVLTLLPAILSGIGPKADWPRIRSESTASRAWIRVGKEIVRRPRVAAIAALVALGVAMIPVLHISVGQTSAVAEAQTGTPHALYQELLSGGVPAGIVTPMEVLVSPSAASPASPASPTAAASPASLEAKLSRADGVQSVIIPNGSAGTRSGYTDVVVIPGEETVNSATMAPVQAVETAVVGEPGVLGVAGEGPGQQAFSHAVYGNAPLMIVVLALLTMLLLARAFRSVVLALKAVLLNIVSLAATFGVLTWFWQEGHGSQALFGIPATGAITFWVPISVFAFLYGLSMDYEVFILTRVREEYDKSGSTETAVIEGLGRTGRLVTCAALILFLAFASLASAPVTDLKVMATGLGVGIILDATVIRGLLVPALVTLLGRANWWFPGWLGRVLQVRPASQVGAQVGARVAGGRAVVALDDAAPGG